MSRACEPLMFQLRRPSLAPGPVTQQEGRPQPFSARLQQCAPPVTFSKGRCGSAQTDRNRPSGEIIDYVGCSSAEMTQRRCRRPPPFIISEWKCACAVLFSDAELMKILQTVRRRRSEKRRTAAEPPQPQPPSNQITGPDLKWIYSAGEIGRAHV